MAGKKPRLPPRASLFRRGDGRLVGMLNLGTRPDGRRDRPSVYGPDAPTIAAKLWTLYEAHIRRERAQAPATLTVGAWLEQWLTEVHAHKVGAGTLYGDRSTMQRYWIRLLGHVRLGQLTSRQVQHALHQLAQEGYAASTIRMAYGLFRQAITHAVHHELLARNPTDVVRYPRAQRQERPAWTLAEARQFWSAIAGHPLEALWVLALTTVLRQSELLGLHWAEVDLARGTLTVRRRLRRVTGQGWDLEGTKTAATARTVALVPRARQALARHKAQQTEARLLLGPRWQDQGLVFPGANGRPRYAFHLRRIWYRLLDEVGLPRIHFHGLRRTAATLLEEQGEGVKTTQQALGHASPLVTMGIYAVSRPGSAGEALARLAQRLEEG